MSRMKTNEELITEIREGINTDENLALLYRQNRGLIAMYAKKYVKAHEDIEDWLSEGYFAIDAAVKSYDPEKGLFTGHLGYQLLKTFTRYWGSARTGRIPKYLLFERMKRYSEAKAEIEADREKAACSDEIAAYSGLTEAQIKNIELARLFEHPVSLNMGVSNAEGEEAELINFIPGDADLEKDYICRTRRKEAAAELRRLLERELSPRQLEAVRLHYWENHTFAEIGEIWGVSKTMASFVHRQAIKKLKKYNCDLLKTIAEDI